MIAQISLVALVTGFLSAVATGQPYVISTFAGAGSPPSPVRGLSVSLGTIWGIATDPSNNVYLSSSDLNSVFRLDAAGQLTLVAGSGRAGYSGDGALAVSAQLSSPHGLVLDANGNLFIADMGNGRVRKVSPDGIITSLPGATQLEGPFSVAVGNSGSIFVAEHDGNRVREILPSGTVTSVAGNGIRGLSGDGGPAVDAQLYAPTGVVVDNAGNLFIDDYGNARVRKVSPKGTIMTVAGGGQSQVDGISAMDEQLPYAPGLAVDAQGNLYIAEEYAGIRKVSQDGTITTVAGGGRDWTFTDGVSATSVVMLPIAVAVDGGGNLFIADWAFNTRVRKVAPGSTLTTVAGNGEICCFFGDGGAAVNAQFSDPSSVAIDPSGNVYIADAHNSRIRKISIDGVIATVAAACSFPDDAWTPCAIAVDSIGNLYSADDSGVFRISPDGTRNKLADFGTGLAVDSGGNLFIADQHHRVIRKISPDGISSTVAGRGTIGFSGDGGPATDAELSLPTSLSVDSAGNLYIADSGNRRIRMISTAGVITTVVDLSADLDGSFAPFGINNLITGLAVDNAGNIFYEELSPSIRRVRRASPDGTITTVAGTGVPGYSGDGGPGEQAEINPSADEIGNTLALDPAGNLYIVDGANNAVRILKPESKR